MTILTGEVELPEALDHFGLNTSMAPDLRAPSGMEAGVHQVHPQSLPGAVEPPAYVAASGPPWTKEEAASLKQLSQCKQL